MNEQIEFNLQVAVCNYLNAQYPQVFFISNTISAIKLTMGQATRNKKVQHHRFKCPDVVVFEKRDLAPYYTGLFLELKKETPFKKDGSIKASQNDHLKLQYESILQLRSKGYHANFYWDFDEIKKTIDWYLCREKRK